MNESEPDQAETVLIDRLDGTVAEMAYITISVRVPAGLRHDGHVAQEIALAAQEFANETYTGGSS